MAGRGRQRFARRRLLRAVQSGMALLDCDDAINLRRLVFRTEFEPPLVAQSVAWIRRGDRFFYRRI